MSQWGQPRDESWWMTAVQYVAFIILAIAFIIAVTATST